MKVFEIRNDLAEIEPLTNEIVTYCQDNGVDDDVCYDVRLALEEAISNTIKYGYEDRHDHTIHVRAGLESHKLFLEIEDDGKSFNPLEAPGPNLSLPVEERPIGRLGIYLLRSVMDEVQYKRTATKNILRMTKRTGQS